MGKGWDQFKHLDEAEYAKEIEPLSAEQLTALHGQITRKLISASMGTGYGVLGAPLTAGISLIPASVNGRRTNVNHRRLKIIEARIAAINAEKYKIRKRDFAIPVGVLAVSFGVAQGAEGMFVEHLVSQHAVHAAVVGTEAVQEHAYHTLHGHISSLPTPEKLALAAPAFATVPAPGPAPPIPAVAGGSQTVLGPDGVPVVAASGVMMAPTPQRPAPTTQNSQPAVPSWARSMPPQATADGLAAPAPPQRPTSAMGFSPPGPAPYQPAPAAPLFFPPPPGAPMSPPERPASAIGFIPQGLSHIQPPSFAPPAVQSQNTVPNATGEQVRTEPQEALCDDLGKMKIVPQIAVEEVTPSSLPISTDVKPSSKAGETSVPYFSPPPGPNTTGGVDEKTSAGPGPGPVQYVPPPPTYQAALATSPYQPPPVLADVKNTLLAYNQAYPAGPGSANHQQAYPTPDMKQPIPQYNPAQVYSPPTDIKQPMPQYNPAQAFSPTTDTKQPMPQQSQPQTAYPAEYVIPAYNPAAWAS